MRPSLVPALAAVALCGCEHTIRVESEARLGGFRPEGAEALARIVYMDGWPCDSVSMLARKITAEHGPETYDATWRLDCDGGAHRYVVIEEARPPQYTFDIKATSRGTVQGESRRPTMLAQILSPKRLWDGTVTGDWWLLLPFALVGVVFWYSAVGLYYAYLKIAGWLAGR